MTRDQAIQKHVGDMLSVDHHILEAIERQRNDEKVRAHPGVNEVVIQAERLLRDHVAVLEHLAKTYDVDSSILKKTVSSLLGAAAGIYDQMREHRLSRILRDDYVALSLAAMSCTALHAFGLAIKEDRIASTALELLTGITPLLVRISKLLPEVVVDETAEDLDVPVDRAAGALAVENTHRTWRPEVSAST